MPVVGMAYRDYMGSTFARSVKYTYTRPTFAITLSFAIEPD